MTTKSRSSKQIDPREMRRSTGMNQTDFWKRISVTQSGGSRYESGRHMPEPVRRLLVMAYGSERDALAEFERLRGRKPTGA